MAPSSKSSPSKTGEGGGTGSAAAEATTSSSGSKCRLIALLICLTSIISAVSVCSTMYIVSMCSGNAVESSNSPETGVSEGALRRLEKQQNEILELLRHQQQSTEEIQRIRENVETDSGGNAQVGSFSTEDITRRRRGLEDEHDKRHRVGERYMIDNTYAENGPQRLYYLREMLSPEECERLLDVAEPYFKPSETMGKSSKDLRNSESAFIEESGDSDEIIQTVVDKMHREAAMPTKFGEVLQLTRYSEYQKYEFHFDSSMELGRLVTVLVFLQDVPEGLGGETVFPHARVKPSQAKNLSKLTGITLPEDEADPAWDDSDLPEVGETHQDVQPSMQQFCDHPRVLKFRPRQGDAIMWFNHDPELLLDSKTVHGGCPPKTDENGYTPQKTIAQRWMRYYRGENEFIGILKDCGVI
eukprot:gb/GECG01008332.1/.p1 GENE.gb/GECG01008332.1/~~gb/GECG01008332.1/.p1  ORF type:complete len:414 (+),score=72.55 gb/GECG01008332.1/:1-1242(+)